MKKLVVIRHAKSSWSNALLEDFDRPLNERGKKDAPIMAKRLKEKRLLPDMLITSPAKRATSTCKKFAKIFDINKKKVVKNPKLYHASEKIILKTVKELDEKYDVIFIFGHNPGLTDFVNIFSNLEIDNVPTCGVTVMEISNWKKFGKEKSNVVYFDYPANIK